MFIGKGTYPYLLSCYHQVDSNEFSSIVGHYTTFFSGMVFRTVGIQENVKSRQKLENSLFQNFTPVGRRFSRSRRDSVNTFLTPETRNLLSEYPHESLFFSEY